MLTGSAAAADSPATIHGVVYGWDTFEPLDNAVVEVNSTPSQSMVAKYGLYSFELAPGAYTIKASYYQNSTLAYSAEESITVDSEGNYVLDLLLLPVYSEELMDSSGTGELSEIPVTGMESQSSGVGNTETDVEAEADVETDAEETGEISVSGSASPASLNTTYLLAAFMLVLLLVGGYHFSLKQKSGEKKSVPEEKAGERQIHTKISVTSDRPETAAKPTAEQAAEQAADPAVKPTAEPAAELITEAEYKIPEKKETEGTGESAEKPGEESVEEIEDTSNPKKPLPLPADLQEIMDIIRGQGGRITQKELRSKLKYSEGKVSLMLTDLERRELVEKFKRGRGNVVILRDEKK